MRQGARRSCLTIAAFLAMTLHAFAEPAASPTGRWLAEDIAGGGVIDRLQTVLEIAGDGRISGTSGCNRIAGKARVEGIRISFGSIASTRMACSPAVMDQERKFLAALEKVRRWHVDPARGKLALLGARGKPLVVFSRM
jgi:putative lipoprotein